MIIRYMNSAWHWSRNVLSSFRCVSSSGFSSAMPSTPGMLYLLDVAAAAAKIVVSRRPPIQMPSRANSHRSFSWILVARSLLAASLLSLAEGPLSWSACAFTFLSRMLTYFLRAF